MSKSLKKHTKTNDKKGIIFIYHYFKFLDNPILSSLLSLLTCFNSFNIENSIPVSESLPISQLINEYINNELPITELLLSNNLSSSVILTLLKSISTVKYDAVIKLTIINIDLSESGEYLSNALKCLSNLNELDLTSCCINSTAMELIASSLINPKSLPISSLTLNYNPLNRHGLASVVSTLSLLPKVTKLSISDINIVGYDIEPLHIFIKSKFCKLNYLNLENNRLGHDGIQLLSDALARNNTINDLNLSMTSFDYTDPLSLQALVRAVVLNDNLEHVNIDGNRIDDEGGLFLLEHLGFAKHLKSFIVTPFMSRKIFSILADKYSRKAVVVVFFLHILSIILIEKSCREKENIR